MEGEHSSDTDGGDDDDGELEKVDIEADDDHHFQHSPLTSRKTMPPSVQPSAASLSSIR